MAIVLAGSVHGGFTVREIESVIKTGVRLGEFCSYAPCNICIHEKMCDDKKKQDDPEPFVCRTFSVNGHIVQDVLTSTSYMS